MIKETKDHPLIAETFKEEHIIFKQRIKYAIVLLNTKIKGHEAEILQATKIWEELLNYYDDNNQLQALDLLNKYNLLKNNDRSRY